MVVATLGVVVLPVGALAVSSQVAAALDGVVVSRQAFKAKAVLALKSSVGTLTAACHNNSFWSRAENEFSADWSVSSPIDSGETPTSADAKADIYQYWNTLSSDFTEIAAKCIISSWT